MLSRSWAAWLRSRTSSSRRKRSYRPFLESLEARVVPAFTTTISTAATSNVLLNSVAGTATFEATGSGANVNVADILAQLQLASTTEVDILNGNTGTETGDITWLAGADLDFRTIGGNKTLKIAMDASSQGSAALSVNSTILDSAPNTESLAVTLNAAGPLNLNAGITTNGGNVNFQSGQTMSLAGAVAAGPHGAVNLA